MKRSYFIYGAVGLVGVILCGFLIEQLFFWLMNPSMKKGWTWADVRNIETALAAYQTEYERPLIGNQAEIIAVLIGDNRDGKNPRRIVFFEPIRNQPARWDDSGALLDSWGSPYQIVNVNTPKPRAYSFGPDRKDDQGRAGSDDIVSDYSPHRSSHSGALR